MIHRATTEFINLYQSEVSQWDSPKTAYEVSETIWAAKYGERKHRSYGAFRDLYRKIQARPDREHGKANQTRQNLRFIEIYNYIADPYRMARDNYEAAEAIYTNEYGTRKFKNFASFVNMRYDYHRNGLIKKTI